MCWKQAARYCRAGAQDYIAKDGLTPLALTRIVENARERLAMSRELLARNLALEQTEKKLFEADRRKDEFIATLAHELRNPLAPIATGLQVLRLTKGSAPPLILDIIERQLGHMTHLIDDLMEISRIRSGKVALRRQRVSVSLLMKEAAETALPSISAAMHSFELQAPNAEIWLDVDPTRMTQVIGNLLNNAVKYSAHGSKIVLSASGDGDEACIQVSDTGMGIPADMLIQVFDMFAQVNNSLQRAHGGLGIGLALVKQLVELHDGKVVAESAGLGQGSTFSVRLPIAPPLLPAAVAALAGAPVQLASLRVLVVDDNVDGANMLSMMLSMSGHAIRTAFSGAEALAIATSFQPEIVFLDLGLPGMSGYEVARQLRSASMLKTALIVALTGWGGEEDRRKSKEAGCDLHMTKPAQPSEVHAVLSQYAVSGNAVS
jgi:signal transduction histidine kinase/ActR/RegA family two-component response regulator